MFRRAKSNKKNIDTSIDISDAIKISKRLGKIKSISDITDDDLQAIQQGARLIELLVAIYGMWSNSKKKVSKLLKMVFGNRSEKLRKLQNGGPNNNTSASSSKNKEVATGNNDKNIQNDNKNEEKKKRKGGGGKNAADDYEAAAEIECKLDDNLLPGKICPECKDNKLFEIDPKKVIRLVGRAPVTAFKFILQRTRCICGAIFTADVGDEFREIYEGDKYSPSALATIMIHKFLMGVTYGKLEKIQQMRGVPVPASTQMNMIKNKALPVFQKIVQELVYLASNAGLIAFDDTRIRTVEKRKTKDGKETHNGHGTAIIASNFDDMNTEIVLFNFETDKHAGEVVYDLLAERERDSLPLLASDGLRCYDKSKEKGIDVNCNSHSRRKVVEEDPNLKTYVGQSVLDCYSKIYINESYCKENKLSGIERMEYHLSNSTVHFEKIKTVFDIITGIDVANDLRVSYSIPDYLSEEEPNSSLYGVATYFLDRYLPLTQVLRCPNAPLDTNDVERIIKIIVLLRKTSLFFHNNFSACYSADILSVLETADHCNINVFEYVDYLLTNKQDVIKNPRNYLPWIYQKSDQEKMEYWAEVDKLIKSPSNFEESSNGENYHSSA